MRRSVVAQPKPFLKTSGRPHESCGWVNGKAGSGYHSHVCKATNTSSAARWILPLPFLLDSHRTGRGNRRQKLPCGAASRVQRCSAPARTCTTRSAFPEAASSWCCTGPLPSPSSTAASMEAALRVSRVSPCSTCSPTSAAASSSSVTSSFHCTVGSAGRQDVVSARWAALKHR